jgi:hypothetical protein
MDITTSMEMKMTTKTWNPKYPALCYANNRSKVKVGKLTANYLQGISDNLVYPVLGDRIKMEDIHPILRDGVMKAMQVTHDLLVLEVEEDEKDPPQDPKWAKFVDKAKEHLRRCKEILDT